MAISDLWTLSQLRAACRRELNDPKGTLSWSWSDTELNDYLVAWQDYLQDRFEFAWGTATVVTDTATITLTAVATNILRLDGIWWNNYRLAGRNKEELEIMQRDWRSVAAGSPTVAYQNDIYSVSFYPPPAGTGTNTFVFEYPVTTTFTADTQLMQIPAWTKYSAVNYVAMRAYLRAGPNQDIARAERRKAHFDRQVRRYQTIKNQCFPAKTPTLRPGGRYEGDILTMGVYTTLFQTYF